MNKTCSKCKNELCISLFYKSKATKDGLQTTCISCQKSRKEYSKTYRELNKDSLAILNRLWREKNKDNIKAKEKIKYLKNADKYRSDRKKHYEDNKATYLHYSKMRKFRIAQASPSWLTQQMIDEIKCIYIESKRMTDSTGIQHEVDHIVPLNGKTVCGLHVPWNLRVITKEENISKFNSLDESLK